MSRRPASVFAVGVALVLLLGLSLLRVPKTADAAGERAFASSIQSTGFLFVKGDAYPKEIQLVGYDCYSNVLTIKTTMGFPEGERPLVPGNIQYYAVVFDGYGEEIGRKGSQVEPTVMRFDPGVASSLTEVDDIQLTKALPVRFSVVVTVVRVY